MTELEAKIYEAMKEYSNKLDQQDARIQDWIDKRVKTVEKVKIEEPERYEEGRKQWEETLANYGKLINHGYGFKKDWMNIISTAMYGKLFSAWEPAHCGCKGHRGTPGYEYTELTEKEIKIVSIVYERLTAKGYLKASKSGMKAKLVK